jgi:hypothetical protein
MSDEDVTNPYTVHLHSGEQGWEVQILDEAGVPVWNRACADEPEGRTLASTIQQHIYWLSPAKFRDYYRLAESA